MTEERGSRSVMDPTDLWRQWYETSTKLWSEAARGAQGGHADPAGFYRQWFEGAREMRERMIGAAPGAVGGNPGVQDLWQRWSEASTTTWQKSTELGQNALDLLPRWTQMLEEARDNLLAGGNLPADPLQFATRWYNATSGPFSDFVGDAIEREEFLEPSSQFLQSYAGFYKVFKRNSEEYLKSLQLPVQSDISRVAGLVINLEDKVDHIEEVLEDLGDATAATAAIETPEAASAASIKTLDNKVDRVEKMLKNLGDAAAATEAPETASAESVQTLGARLDGVEGKLDRLLAALENQDVNASAQANGSAAVEATDAARREAADRGVDLTQVEPTGSGGRVTVVDVVEFAEAGQEEPAVEIKATDAARRKAGELGVDLAEVEGTGADGQITIEDVRKKGDS
ncbi:MAG: E3 binding domain-containing protein [Rubrobacter sp.]